MFDDDDSFYVKLHRQQSRRAVSKSRQEEAGELYAAHHADKGPRVKAESSKNVFVYFDALPNTRLKIGANAAHLESRREIPASEYSPKQVLWVTRKTFKTKDLADPKFYERAKED